MIGSTPQGTPAQTYYGSPEKLEKIWECWQLWPIVGGVANGAAEEDWCWDLNPVAATMRGLLGTTRVGQRRTTDFYFFS